MPRFFGEPDAVKCCVELTYCAQTNETEGVLRWYQYLKNEHTRPHASSWHPHILMGVERFLGERRYQTSRILSSWHPERNRTESTITPCMLHATEGSMLHATEGNKLIIDSSSMPTKEGRGEDGLDPPAPSA